MKRIIVMMTALLAVISASAQSHSNRIGIGSSLLYERGLDASVFWEHETSYHNAWEVFANGYLKWDDCASCGKVCSQSFWKSYNTWAVGAAYKPCIVRSRNRYGSFRFGASAGSDTHKFLAGLHLGYEQNYALKHGWVFYWGAKVDVMLPKREDLFRSGVTIGIKLPVGNRLHL